jgi:hypothetical protein
MIFADDCNNILKIKADKIPLQAGISAITCFTLNGFHPFWVPLPEKKKSKNGAGKRKMR